MSYIQNNLLKDEKMMYFTRMHWIVFLMPVFILFATLIVSIFAQRLFPGYVPFWHVRLARLVPLIFFMTAIIFGVSAFISYTTSEYGITNRRLLIKTGWIRRDTWELFLDMVVALNVDQSILGRMLDYGTLRVVVTGGTQEPFFYIPHPFKFRKIAQQQVDIRERKVMTPSK